MIPRREADGDVKLGEHLLADRVIDGDQLQAGLDRAARTGERLGTALIGLGHATGDQIATALARQHDVPAARDRHLANASQRLAHLVPALLAHRLRAVVIGEGRDRELIIALADPVDADSIEALENATRRVVIGAAASIARLDEAVTRLHPITHDNIAAAAFAAAEIIAARQSSPSGMHPTVPTAPVPRPNVDTPAVAAAVAVIEAQSGPVAAAAPPPAEPAATALDLPDEPELSLEPPADAATNAQLGSPRRRRAALQPMTSQHPVIGPVAVPRTTTTRLPLAGGTTAAAYAAPSAGSGTLARLGLGLVISSATAALVYRQCTNDDTRSIPDGVYRSAQLGASFDLPGVGWRTHASLSNTRNQGGMSARAEGYFRGENMNDPDDGVIVLRIHAPGQFPQEVDMDAFKQDLERLGAAVTSSASNLAMQNLDCTIESRVRPEPAGHCRGAGSFRDHPVDVYVFYWEDTVNDMVGVIYVARGSLDDKLEAVQNFIRDLQIE